MFPQPDEIVFGIITKFCLKHDSHGPEAGRITPPKVIKSALVFMAHDYPEIGESLLYSQLMEKLDVLIDSWPNRVPPYDHYYELVREKDMIKVWPLEGRHAWWNELENVTTIKGIPITTETKAKFRDQGQRWLEKDDIKHCEKGIRLRKEHIEHAKTQLEAATNADEKTRAEAEIRRSELELAFREEALLQAQQVQVDVEKARVKARNARKRLRWSVNKTQAERAAAEESVTKGEQDLEDAMSIFKCIPFLRQH